MTDISQIKKALENFHVLFIEDDSEFALKERPLNISCQYKF